MYKKVIKFTDYDGNEREGTFYFNLTKAEIIKWEGMTTGTLRQKMEQIIQTDDREEMIQLFDDIISRAYGEKSLDGMYFRKSPQILDDFKSTEAYTNLFMELSSDDQAAAEFVNGIIPGDLLEAVEAERKRREAEAKLAAPIEPAE